MSDLLDRVRRADPVRRDDAGRTNRAVDQLKDDILERCALVVPIRPRVLGRRRPGGWIAAVAAGIVATAISVVALPPPSPDSDVGRILPPEVSPRMMALDVASRFFAALTEGDAGTALGLMDRSLVERSSNLRHGIEFLAAIPGTKRLVDCTVLEGTDEVHVSCDLVITDPILSATGHDVRAGSVTVGSEGVIAARPQLSDRSEADRAFVAYATVMTPERFASVCAPSAYPPGSVDIVGGHAFAGPCGELWAQLSRDVADWIRAGRPDIAP